MILPYPGFSWSIGHHMGPAGHHTLMYRLLESAYKHMGEDDYQDLISADIEALGLIPPNVRGSRGQIWRDYQQVLPELGLMISTKITRAVVITPVGMLWLDGGIGYKELMTTQCLNYQYPNGFKLDISPAQRSLLVAGGYSVPETRAELDATNGVLLKPAVLLLRLLLELLASGKPAKISPQVCLGSVVPIASNSNWKQAYAELVKKSPASESDARRLRHVNEWFRLLSYTEIFALDGANLTLAPYALSNADKLLSYSTLSEDPSTFWIPTNFDRRRLGLSWFSYYGNLPLGRQLLRQSSEIDVEYVSENYVEGIDDEESSSEERVSWVPEFSLKPFSPSDRATGAPGVVSTTIDKDKILNGRLLGAQKTILHDRIVTMLATRLQGAGYQVSEDRNSVDLLATRDNDAAIIEVKTVNLRNLSNRMRLAIGQLSEYRYRHHLSQRHRPDAVLVLSSYAEYPSWVPDFFQNDLKMGLVSLQGEALFSHTSGQFETALASLS